ncbi:hypothetical protein B0H63DRAFT_18024 [Podospora didyma]|uniref:Uncharacterized protein n=1 Tax=Podospora didyma TaxID=330526 RepID=A0AAE0P540_9PEZI|nr:hypothetical protein B0H63DRAFT_18024 [Podospora didyma]
MFYPPNHASQAPVGEAVATEHTLEERRAVLGCLYMSSIISSYLGQIDALRWTPYMEECLRIIRGRSSTECPTDEYFAYQVELQRVSRDLEDAKSLAAIPPSLYLKAVQARLDGIKENMSPQFLNDETLLGAVYFAELSIFEWLSQDTSLGPNAQIQRIEYLYKCLQTVKAAMESFFRILPAEYRSSSTSSIAPPATRLPPPATTKSRRPQTV